MRKKNKLKWSAGLIAIVSSILVVVFALKSNRSLVLHPKGLIAYKELNLIILNYLLMLIVVIPTFIFLFVIAWRYRAKNTKAKYKPEHSHGKWSQAVLWLIPSAVVAVMAVHTWHSTHELDPYRPIASDVKPLEIQVVALDWKWLFIYPKERIATVNFVQFPEKTPIRFLLCADDSPMNSFWIPELSGQIYAMTGMTTQLHMMADAPGVYMGRAAEINGWGFSDMTFTAKSSSQKEFESWVASVKRSPLKLNRAKYEELLKPSVAHPVVLYSRVEENLFDKIVMKYMMHH
jgi:cytochrome o ubiquinol oxidase subunit 2